MVGFRPPPAWSAPAWGSEPPHLAWNILIPSEDNSGMIQSDDGAVVEAARVGLGQPASFPGLLESSALGLYRVRWV